jgi:UDP-N-acetylmuramoyl-L-alanyl-D-glutamate--2,6-diaminopimelate ligase
LQIIKQSRLPSIIINFLVRCANSVHFVETFILSTLYGWPQKRMRIIAVTGTDGKTTTSYMIHAILKGSGYRVGLITSVAAHIGNKKLETGAHVTTPSRLDMQKLLKEMVKEGCEYLVLEMTAHAIDQHRLVNLYPEVLVFTNITPEHLDYFGTFDDYAQTKARLIKKAKNVLINAQDPAGNYLENECRRENIRCIVYQTEVIGSRLEQSWEQKFPGDYNKQNAAAAYETGVLLSINKDAILKSISDLEPPEGRYQVLHAKPTVVVDFAHTPNALKVLLESIKKQNSVGRVIAVFGCAGERDQGKRPLMGKIAVKYADQVILTAEDPRTEILENINEQIKSQLTPSELDKISCVDDRKEAISKALASSRPGDTVVITGKGHEESMCFGKVERPWNDIEVVKELLRERQLTPDA